MLTEKTKKRINRHKRIRAKISGTNSRPRISVFKSNISLQVQAINDETNKTILSGNTESKKGTKTEQSKDLGLNFAKNLLAKDIKEAVLDRGGNLYTGRIKAFTEGLREAGLKI